MKQRNLNRFLFFALLIVLTAVTSCIAIRAKACDGCDYIVPVVFEKLNRNEVLNLTPGEAVDRACHHPRTGLEHVCEQYRLHCSDYDTP